MRVSKNTYLYQLTLIMFISSVVLFGCKSVPDRGEKPINTSPSSSPSTATAPSTPAVETDSHGRKIIRDNAGRKKVFVEKKEFGKEWPLTVNSGYVVSDGMAVLFENNGTLYAVNGIALGQKKYPEIRKIWADDPAYPDMDLKKNIGPIIDIGIELQNK